MSVTSFEPEPRPTLLEQFAALLVGSGARRKGPRASRGRSPRRSSAERAMGTALDLNPARDPSYPVSMPCLSAEEAEAWGPIVKLAAGLDAAPAARMPRQPIASPALLDRLMTSLDGPDAHGETRDVTVLFADVRGFTGFAEALKDDPRRLADLICGILDPLSEVVLAHGGTIDKYMGDCVMAFWGAPDDDPDHALRAFEAAKAMIPAMDAVNVWVRDAFSDLDLPRIEIGIGINSGSCLVGNVGSRRRFDYSVLGDPVNVASRLEGLCKTYDTALIVGEETASRLPVDAALREIDQVALRGRAGKQRVYGLAAG